MWRIKQLADPEGILAPGVVLNRDPQVHLKHLKSMPEIEEVATKCIECGFCEPVCPSRNVTTTPRQRIVLRREMARQPAGSPVLDALLEQYEYDAIQTCAADGSCGPACPVAIDTGKLIKELRRREHSERSEQAAVRAAKRYATAERAARAALRAAAAAASVVGDHPLTAATTQLRRLTSAELLPEWRTSTPRPAPPKLPFTLREGAAAVYLPACINRVFGNARSSPVHPTTPEALVAVSQRAGLPLWIPPDVAGHCCGTPWSSKGFRDGHQFMGARIKSALERWSEDGKLPVVVDASSCTLGIREETDVQHPQVLDSIEWVHDHVLPRLNISRRLRAVAVHPNCSAKHLGLSGKLTAIAGQLADEVVIPTASGCCGMAGDRGWLHPELPASALRDTARELGSRDLDAYLSSNRTCEAALQEITGRNYKSFVQALEELTRR